MLSFDWPLELCLQCTPFLLFSCIRHAEIMRNFESFSLFSRVNVSILNGLLLLYPDFPDKIVAEELKTS